MIKERERQSVTLENKGQRIFGMMHPPAFGENAPAVLIFHGFGGTKCGRHRLYVTLAEKLAEQGFAVFRFDFRGAGDSEGDFHDISVSGQESDAAIALDYLASQPYVDASRIGIMGCSFGGIIAVLTAAKRKEIKSLVLWSPPCQISDWLAMWEQAKVPMSLLPKEQQIIWFQSEPATAAFVQEFLTMPLQEQMNALQNIPLLHFHGEKDTIVEPKHAQFYEKSRTGIEAQSQFVKLPNCAHDFGDPVDQQILIGDSCQWFQKTLK